MVDQEASAYCRSPGQLVIIVKDSLPDLPWGCGLAKGFEPRREHLDIRSGGIAHGLLRSKPTQHQLDLQDGAYLIASQAVGLRPSA